MGKGSWSRRRHMTEARSSTEAGRSVVRQVRQVMMQYLLFRYSRGGVMIIHEEADGWRMHISWGRKTWCGAHLVGEKAHLVWNWGRKAHLVWKFPGEERDCNVVAEPEDCCARSAHKAKRGRLKILGEQESILEKRQEE
ncbi:hypothetical protein F2Q69_00020184 [Brassica cretica]|uniref:Uncharacterized protein n=1 Tax=Brassica cretica TaxID=69181 RepID=A0A8S9Q984_BRACR|nr:hypothetical protein F2Q69_00020184 [Brassica cretica]